MGFVSFLRPEHKKSTISRANRVLGEGSTRRGKRFPTGGKGLICSFKGTETENDPTAQGRTPRSDRL